VSARWFALPEHHDHIELDAFVVMPNHVHGIIILPDVNNLVGTMPALSVPKSSSLSTVISLYKSSVTRHSRNANPEYRDITIWQGRFHDHIIRNEPDLNRIREYVQNNPALWEADTFYDS
jgi:putative transposase